MEKLVLGILITVSLVLTVQAIYTLYMMLYTWDQVKVDRLTGAPERFIPPSLSFTAIVPARHEQEVIATTVDRIARSDYPRELLQVLVVCSADDKETIDAANQKIEDLAADGIKNVELVVFDDEPVNKPHGLNCALRRASNDVVTVFDAEDETHPAIFSLVNTVMVTEKVKVVQAGVQLMNYNSNWYSTFNVLEYFFWFKSRLHYQARRGSIPLGGNTVFLSRELLEEIGGWDETNLTEDAELGLRLSAMGERIRVMYDDRYVTKEETPPTLSSFIRQRTRWSQGFMQTLRKGTWKQMPTRQQRFLAFYTLAFPHAQVGLAIYVPIALLTMLLLKAPVLLVLLSFLPVLAMVAHYLATVVGLYEFADAHGLKPRIGTVVKMAIWWFPYQFVLGYAAVRALRRYLTGAGDWEKTQHIGAHRTVAEEAAEHVA
jgi:cellulose synthase/poly-beta-1,6-N-acetylglucosamine synthase-like glycosyltransferase